MNILFTRGGQILVEHMKRVLVESNLRRQDYAQDLDERGKDHKPMLLCRFMTSEILIQFENYGVMIIVICFSLSDVLCPFSFIGIN